MTKRKLLNLLATMQANYRNTVVPEWDKESKNYYRGRADCCCCIANILTNKKYYKWFSKLQDLDYIKNEQRYKQKC